MKVAFLSRLVLIAVAAVCVGAQAFATELKIDFSKRLALTLEYIDYPDVLVAVAAGNYSPWERYDQGERYRGRKTTLEKRWYEAISFSGAQYIDHEIISIYRILSENPQGGFRETPIDDVGGDIDKNVDGPGGFDRVTSAQAETLQSNPFLVVTVKPDRYVTGRDTVLVRYRYPSAGTYTKFIKYLSTGLQQELKKAEQAGLLRYDIWRPESVGPEFRKLTVKIINELLRVAYVPSESAAANYQRFISVHPFDDYNGRSLRAWYRKQANRPMFLLDFYCDLYCSPAKFATEIRSGNAQYDLIVKGLALEEKRQSPDFYSIPEFWMVAAGVKKAPADSVRFVSASKSWFLETRNAQRVDHKLFGEMFAEYREFVRQQGLFAFLFDWLTFMKLRYV